MANRVALNLGFTRRLLLLAAGAVMLAAPVRVGLVNGQPQPAFEAASVKPSQGSTGQYRYTPGGAMDISDFT